MTSEIWDFPSNFADPAGEGFQLLGTVLLGGAFCGAHPGRRVAWRGLGDGPLGMGLGDGMDDGWMMDG